MKGWYYQLKNSCHDKLCLLAFFLPILTGALISGLTEADFSSVQEISFYVVENMLPSDTIALLESYGNITVFPDISSMEQAVNNPSTQGIGILQKGDSIQTLLSGDELTLYSVVGDTLPSLLSAQDMQVSPLVTVLPSESSANTLLSLLNAIVIFTAMFMGCTFNAMSIIGEKEDGISLINEVLPMTKADYFLQKIMLGLAGGILSSLLTALVCFPVTSEKLLPLLLLILLSTLSASVIGLIIGTCCTGLMSAITSTKLVMILLLAPPIFFYLVIDQNHLLFKFSYLLPSSAAFYGLIGLFQGNTAGNGFYLFILTFHCLLLLILFVRLPRRK